MMRFNEFHEQMADQIEKSSKVVTTRGFIAGFSEIKKNSELMFLCFMLK